MEEVLEVYARKYDPLEPVVCLDEQPQVLHSHAREALPMTSGMPIRQDDEYVRQGTANVFCLFEPLRGWREMRVTHQRTLRDLQMFFRCCVMRFILLPDIFMWCWTT